MHLGEVVASRMCYPMQPAMVPGGSQLSGWLRGDEAGREASPCPQKLKMPPPLAAVLPITWL